MAPSKITRKQFGNAAVTFFLIEVSRSVAAIVDGIITGNFLGTVALAAVGLADIYFSLCAVIGFTLAAAAQTLCTFHLGKGNKEKSNEIYSTVIVLAALLATALLGLGIGLAGPLSTLVGAGQPGSELYQQTKFYFIGLFAGAIPNVLLSVLGPLLSLDGQNKRANLSSLVIFVVDVGLDLLNVLVLHWGTLGMGLATSISQAAALVVVLCGLLNKKCVFSFSFHSVNFHQSGKIFRTGFPRGVGMIARALGPMILKIYVGSLAGTPGLTALSVQTNVKYLSEAPGTGISGAVLLLNGYFYGEGDKDGISRVMKISFLSALIILVPLGAILALLSPYIATLYMNRGDAAYSLSVDYLRVYFISLPFIGLNAIAANHLLSVDKKIGSYACNIANEFVGLVACAFLFGQLWGIQGVWWSFLAWQVLLFLAYLFIGLFRKSKCQKGVQKILYLSDAFLEKERYAYSANILTLEDCAHEAEKAQKFCLEHGVNSKKSMQIALCLEELSSNAVSLGFQNKKNNAVEFRVVVQKDCLMLHLRDNAKKFDFKQRATQICDFDPEHPERHIGTRIVMGAASDISYSYTLNTNNLSIKITR